MTRYLALLSVLSLTACGPPERGAGFGEYGSAEPAARASSPDLARDVSEAASSAQGGKSDSSPVTQEMASRVFVLGPRTQDPGVIVAGVAMKFRLVPAQGRLFGLYQPVSGPYDKIAQPDMTDDVAKIAAAQSGCRVGGQIWRQTYPNGIQPKYAVPLQC